LCVILPIVNFLAIKKPAKAGYFINFSCKCYLAFLTGPL
jgi:hypothetical protein